VVTIHWTAERRVIEGPAVAARAALRFPTDKEFEEWIKKDVFERYQGRYHYTSGKEADVIVLARKGLAFGYFEIDGKDQPNKQDFRDYPETKFVYLVRSSAMYDKPVRLADLGIKNYRFGLPITEEQFDKIKKAAGGIRKYPA
jgi:hypothetical protein